MSHGLELEHSPPHLAAAADTASLSQIKKLGSLLQQKKKTVIANCATLTSQFEAAHNHLKEREQIKI